MPHARPQHEHAFSFVELSIVIVIGGLFIGGALAGKSLLRAADVRDVITGFQRIQSATLAFKEQYNYLPGDFPTATSVWGDDSTNCADGAITNGTPGTCNGNGDGQVVYTSSGEAPRALQQLSLAGLLEGSYTGLGILDKPGQNVAPGKIAGSGFALLYATTRGYSSGTVATDVNRILFGLTMTGTATPSGAVLTPPEAWGIDKKMDDGDGYAGNVRAWSGWGYSAGCLNGATYTYTASTIDCFMNMAL